MFTDNSYTTKDLEPIYSNRKSFYGKARVRCYDDGTKELVSYSTVVAEIDKHGILQIHGKYSNTTSKHTKEFLLQNGFDIPSKDWDKYIISYV